MKRIYGTFMKIRRLMIRASLQMGFRLGEKGQDEEPMKLVKEAGNSAWACFSGGR